MVYVVSYKEGIIGQTKSEQVVLQVEGEYVVRIRKKSEKVSSIVQLVRICGLNQPDKQQAQQRYAD